MTGLSINHYIAPPGYPFERFLDDCTEAGATGVGLTERALGEVALPDLKRLLAERKLHVTSVNSAGFFLWGDEQKAKRQQAINASLIHAAAELSADTLVTIGGGLYDRGAVHPGDLQRARQDVEQALPALLDAALARGVKLGLEPMHPARIPVKGTLNTLSQTETLCTRHEGIGFALDVFHTWWDPDLEPVLARLVSRLTLVQLVGVEVSSDPTRLPSRCGMREGAVDIAELIRLLRRCGYAGHYEFELFADDLGGRTVADTIRCAVEDFFVLSAS